MSKKVLSVIDNAYRAAQEEQDDAGLWFTAAVKNAGVEDVTILLTGNAVNYAVKDHATDPMTIGGGSVPHPFDPSGDITRMVDKGISFYLLRDDAEQRGIDPAELIGNVELISRSQLADFIGQYDSIWHW
jgi:predicted peroxiredoxin